MTALLLLMVSLFNGCSDDPSTDPLPPTVVKTNAMKVYMHYMPWFQSKDVSGYWGSHWRMTNKDPEIIDGDGKRQIASHYYPLIGPYDSKDPDVIEYHLLLMKYAGVDGVLIDWYSSHNINDYKPLLTASNALVDKIDDVGLTFGLVYEDYTAKAVDDQSSKTAMQAAQADMLYMQENYFNKKEYITINNGPLLLTFGPRQFKKPSEWAEIFSGLKQKPKFLPLWGHTAYTGENDNGEYAWVDFDPTFSELNSFYTRQSHVEISVGSAYPRFHDYYVEGGTGQSYGYVDFNNGQTLINTLQKATDRGAQYLQLVTWNDFGEGTVIEPTLEDQFKCLEIIQDFTGVSYGLPELQLVHEYYLKKVKYKNDEPASIKLKEVFTRLSFLEVDKARQLLDELE